MIPGRIRPLITPESEAGRDPRLVPGLEELDRGRYEFAARALEPVARTGGSRRAASLAAEARLGLGRASVHAGEFAAARCELELALGLDPSCLEAARLLGRVLLRAGEPERALEWLDHAAIDGTESHDVTVLRAACLDALGRRGDAHRTLDGALASALRAPLGRRDAPRPTPPHGGEPRLDPAHAFHADRRCELAMRLLAPRPAEAVEHLEAALSLNPRFLKARLALALVRLGQRRAREAVEALEAARELEPTYPDVRAWLGLARLASGDAHGAVGALERAVTLQREFARAHRHLALAYHAVGRTREALRAARRGWIRDTEVDALGDARVLSGFEAACADEAQLVRALAVRPRAPDLHVALGKRRRDRGDHMAAREAFRAALALRPGYATATLALARTEIAMSRVRDAELHLAELVGWRPTWVDAQALLGRTRLLLGDPRGAVGPLRAAVRLRPDLEPARTDLGWAVLTFEGRGARDGRAA